MNDFRTQVWRDAFKLTSKYENVPPAGSKESDAFWKAFIKEHEAMANKFGIDKNKDPIAFHVWVAVIDGLNDEAARKAKA